MTAPDFLHHGVAGFTGPRGGLTNEQCKLIIRLLTFLQPAGLHHGDCKGADADAVAAARALGIPAHAHPGLSVKWRAHTAGNASVAEPKPELERDRDIVTACGYLIATPETPAEKIRSGTWATIRYARAARKPIHYIFGDGCGELVLPDGSCWPLLTTPLELF